VSASARVDIVNERGLHARASARFVKLAGSYDADVQVTKDDQTVDAQSIMGLMMLAAGPGSTIEITAKGRQAREAVEALIGLVASRFEEER
jgi:phosphocarrier protein